jgi:hypothetical protein
MFPAAPFYIKIDREIMKVTKKDGNGGAGAPGSPDWPDPDVWTVERGLFGTQAAFHAKSNIPANIKTCVYMLAPPRFIRDVYAGLAARGQPNQRPNAGRPAANQRRR